VNIGNTIVADNTATFNPDVNGAIASQGFNLIRTRGTSFGYVTSDLPDGSNPMLEALGNNGGPTQTHRLLAGSAAIDKGNSFGLTTDQRGLTRPVDNPGITNATGGDGADIGAFEVQLAPTAATVSISGRVMTASGRGIRNVRLTLTDSSGQIRTATTTSFGYYRFDAVQAGETYILSAVGKRYTFSQPLQVLNINEDTEAVNFIADSK
jgi:hypothetical protein